MQPQHPARRCRSKRRSRARSRARAFGLPRGRQLQHALDLSTRPRTQRVVEIAARNTSLNVIHKDARLALSAPLAAMMTWASSLTRTRRHQAAALPRTGIFGLRVRTHRLRRGPISSVSPGTAKLARPSNRQDAELRLSVEKPCTG